MNDIRIKIFEYDTIDETTDMDVLDRFEDIPHNASFKGIEKTDTITYLVYKVVW